MKKNTNSKNYILVVEDDHSLFRGYEFFLQREGYDVGHAEDGMDALNKIKERKPDLILLDLMMPRMNGFELLKQLKGNRDTKNIPVIVISTMNVHPTSEEVMALGAKEYLCKPDVSPIEIITSIKKNIPGTDPLI